jgi:Family of unknown function (DUF5670)
VIQALCPPLARWHVACVYSPSAQDGSGIHSIPRRNVMLWTIFVILLVLWAVGMVSSYTLGGFIHLLLLIAIAVVLIRIIQGRRPV